MAIKDNWARHLGSQAAPLNEAIYNQDMSPFLTDGEQAVGALIEQPINELGLQGTDPHLHTSFEIPIDTLINVDGRAWLVADSWEKRPIWVSRLEVDHGV